jgi:GNAT superfamily N-acetyltransferase
LPIEIVSARSIDDLDGLSEVLREYMTFNVDQFREIAGIDIDAESYVENTFTEIDLYYPPRGRLLLAREGRRLIGIGFLKPIRDEICEIKRMYVLPDQRGKSLGKMILTRLIDEAKEIGYAKILLDTACFATAAHSLYRSMGFTDVDYYSEAETDEALKEYLVYMEMKI